MASEGDERMDRDYAVRAGEDRENSMGAPDLQLDVPMLNVEEIDLEVEDLRVRLSVQAELADLVKINIGLDAELGEAKLGIKGVEAQAQLKASLDNVRAIFSEVVDSLQHNPQYFRETDQTEPEAGAEPEATSAAIERAEQLGVELSGIEGTGSGGRIVVRDVVKAAGG